MTREVWIFIRSLQNVGTDEEEPVEIVSAGTYYNRNGKHYILYDTVEEESASPTANMVKISPDFVELTRKGSQAVRMDFRQGIRTSTRYPTPCGLLCLGITTYSVQVDETDGQIREMESQVCEAEGQIEVRMEYMLDAGGERIADYVLTIKVKPRTEISD